MRTVGKIYKDENVNNVKKEINIIDNNEIVDPENDISKNNNPESDNSKNDKNDKSSVSKKK